ncbi:hypothetical protein [Azospirillum sp.]|uniref:hypothetical protein n=1 Tax=Azospirillum sp. TaxID=34012 RepID=UPI003D724E6B
MSAVLTFPQRSAQRPARVHAELERQPVHVANDWMQAVAVECGRHSTLCPPIFDFLKRTGLLSRCVLIASDPGGPLTWRYVGEPTVSVMGRAWGRENLGRPVTVDERADFGDSMNTSYAEAIDTGRPLVNRVRLFGHASPLVYLHSLIGWKASDGRRAVLSCVQL